MKIIWNPALTLDGYIAKEDGDTSWISDTEGEACLELIRECGCAIVGRATYEMDKEFFAPVADKKLFVWTRQPRGKKADAGVAYVSGELAEVLKHIESQGFATASLIGGGKTNGAFAAAGLIDEVIVNIYPLIFGEGVPALGGVSCRLSLKLLGRQRLPGGIIRCHYQVVR